MSTPPKTWDASSILTQLKRDEGVRLKAYKDSVGIWTIGVGRNLEDVGISLAEADSLLANDIQRAVADVAKRLSWADSLDDARHGVLVNMAFNLGIGGLMKFKNFLAAMEAQDWETAARQMLESKWAEQVGERAKRLSLQVTSGIWQ